MPSRLEEKLFKIKCVTFSVMSGVRVGDEEQMVTSQLNVCVC